MTTRRRDGLYYTTTPDPETVRAAAAELLAHLAQRLPELGPDITFERPLNRWHDAVADYEDFCDAVYAACARAQITIPEE